MDEINPVKEADVPEENPQAIGIGDYPGTVHQIVRETADSIETACGRGISPGDGNFRCAWVDTDFRFACDDCAEATGLNDLDEDTVLGFLREKIGKTTYAEVPADSDVPMTDLPMIEVTPREADHVVPGPINSYMRHLNYTFAGADTDHRGAPLVMYSPNVSGVVHVHEVREQ